MLQGNSSLGAQATYAGPTLALYLVADEVTRDSLQDGTATPAGLKLKARPILADADFVAWDTAKQSFVITPTAAKRVVGSCAFRSVPFVLASRGEPVYVGLFGTLVSSQSAAVPTILTDSVLSDCFMGFTNVPMDVLHMIGRADPGVTDALMGLTNATTNVTLRIDRGYPPPDGFGPGRYGDRREDNRITAAVRELFGRKEK